MSAALKTMSRRRPRKVETIAPALALLAQGVYAKQVAESVGVSTATILTWMDWGWKHRHETEAYLRKHYPDLSEEDLAGLWARVARRRAKRERRLDFTDVLAGKTR